MIGQAGQREKQVGQPIEIDYEEWGHRGVTGKPHDGTLRPPAHGSLRALRHENNTTLRNENRIDRNRARPGRDERL